MQGVQTDDKTINISREKLVSLVGQAFGRQSYPYQDDPQPPGRWDDYIRKALGKVKYPFPEPDPHPEWEHSRRFFGPGGSWRNVAFGPSPEPWRRIDSLAALNPQPLPPRELFLAAVAQEVIDRALLVYDVAMALNQTGEEQAIIIVSGAPVHKFTEEIDELCPRLTELVIHPPTGGGGDSDHPDPILPHFNKELSSLELLVVASVFQQNAATTLSEEMRGLLNQAAAKLAELGISRR